MSRGVFVVTLDGVEGGLLWRVLLDGTFGDEFVGGFQVVQFSVQFFPEDLFLDVTSFVLETGFLGEAE